MNGKSRKRTAKLRTALTIPVIAALEVAEKSWIAWDDKVTGFGVRVHPTGIKSFIVNFRTRAGGRNALNKRLVIGKVGQMLPGHARQRARKIIERAACGDDPQQARAETLAMPTLAAAFEAYMRAATGRAQRTDELYRYEMKRYLGDWRSRPLDTIEYEDIKDRFELITTDHGWSAANRTISLLRSVYQRPCADFEGLRNPVSLWLDTGGSFHRKARRTISPPAEILPCWRTGIEAEVFNPVMRDALWCAIYTGMHRDEVLTLRWERLDMEARTFRLGKTRTGVHLALPMTTHLATIVDRRRSASMGLLARLRAWVFPSPTSASGHVEDPHHLYSRISEAGGAKFWFQGMRDCFIAVAERELMLPTSLTDRLVNRARRGNFPEDHGANWTIDQLREPAQRIADRIETLMNAPVPGEAARTHTLTAFPTDNQRN